MKMLPYFKKVEKKLHLRFWNNYLYCEVKIDILNLNQMIPKIFFTFQIVLIFLLSIFFKSTARSEDKFPKWKEGEMEIHHIYTGRGECVFCIFPDGTNLLIDAGDTGPHRDPRTTHGTPNETIAFLS